MAPAANALDAVLPALAAADLLGRDLVCVDLETTGGNPAWNRITEVGIVELDRDGTVREWSTLVNPGVRMPPHIAEFTGITDEMVADAPSFADVHREVLARLQGRVLVAHNARFDYGFLRSEFQRLDVRYAAKVLCTVKLSRRLYPEQPRHNLDAVIARHGLDCEARHRALGDARVLRDLLSVLVREVEPARLSAMVEALLQETPLPPQLPPELADDLPESPGVYRFYGEDDALLYVGKSRNIRTRVLEHFAQDHRSSKELKLSRQVRRVDWTETTGELGALLVEARSVKTDRPMHNRRLRGSTGTYTLRLVPGEAGVPQRVAVAELDALEVAEQAELYGLYRDPRTAKRAIEEIARAHQLCVKAIGLQDGEGSCFAYQLKKCRGACVGREPALLHDTRVRLALAAQRLKPWPYRGRIAVVEHDWRGREDWHVLDGWRWLGTARELDEARALADDAVFDVDVYKILKRFLATPDGARIVELGA